MPPDTPPTSFAPSPAAAAPGSDGEPRRLLAGFEPLGTSSVFGQVQRAVGIEAVGLLGVAAITPEALVAVLEADFAGVGMPHQTRLLAHPEAGYVLEDARFGFRVPTGIGPAQAAPEQAYSDGCIWLRSAAAKLLTDLQAGEKLFVHVTQAATTPDSLHALHRAVARLGKATLLAVAPGDDAARIGQVAWLAPGLMLGWVAAQTTLDGWIALSRRAADLARTAPGGRPIRLGICAIVRDEGDYIEEWVAFHRAQGVTQFRIYDNGSTDGTPLLLQRLGIAPVIWAGRPDDFDGQQRAAYQEAAQTLADDVDWLACIDADEFLFGRNRTLAEALAAFPAEVGAIAVQQRVFGSGGHSTRTRGPVIERFTRAAPRQHAEHRWFKTIARPQRIAAFDSVHSVVLRAGSYVMADGSPLVRTSPHPGEAAQVVQGIVGLHHYSLKSLAEFRVKQAKWADRGAAVRIGDGYFFDRDAYANLEECRDLAELAPAIFPASHTVRAQAAKPVLFVQTADPVEYRPMLDLTSPVNIAYCQRRGYRYECYIGIKRGEAPLQATYNRIFILQELMARGHRGWVCYMDADAFVTDFAFDLESYLADNSAYCLIACTGGSSTPWDINAGVFFLNLGDEDGRALAHDWFAKFETMVPAAFLASDDAQWGGAPDDQQILYEVLKGNPVLLRRTKKEDDGSLFNYRDGRFIRQATRASFADANDRMSWIGRETSAVLAANERPRIAIGIEA